MKIEIGVKGKGIFITTVRKEEEELLAQYNAGFEFAKKIYYCGEYE